MVLAKYGVYIEYRYPPYELIFNAKEECGTAPGNKISRMLGEKIEEAEVPAGVFVTAKTKSKE